MASVLDVRRCSACVGEVILCETGNMLVLKVCEESVQLHTCGRMLANAVHESSICDRTSFTKTHIYIYIAQLICICTYVYMHRSLPVEFYRRLPKKHTCLSFGQQKQPLCYCKIMFQLWLETWSGKVAVWPGNVAVWSAKVAVSPSWIWSRETSATYLET